MESKRFEIFKMVFGFILTGVVGTIVSDAYKNSEATEADFKNFRQRAAEVHDSVTNLSGRSLFATRVLLNTLRDIKDLEVNREDVRSAHTYLQNAWMDWNASLARNTQAIHFFYGDKTVKQWNAFKDELDKVNGTSETEYLEYLNSGNKTHGLVKPSSELLGQVEKLWGNVYALSDSMQGEMFSVELRKKWLKEREDDRTR